MHPVNERLKQPGGLAERLYGLRKDAGLTQERMAEALGWPPTKISKIENGNQIPTAEDIRSWAGAVDHPEATDDLLDLLAEVQTVHRRWKQRLRRGGLAAVQEDHDRRAREAKRTREANVLLVPGLLQTAGYARSVVAGLWPGRSAKDVDEAVALRMRRQEVLYDTDRTFEFVITGAALRLLPCPPTVMAGQLDRLLSMGLPNVTLGIIPLGVELPLVPLHGFLLLDDTAIVETYDDEYEASEEDSEMYAQTFGRLMAEAVTGEETRRLIAAAAADLRES